MQNIDPSLLQQLIQNNPDGTSPTINIFPESFINLLTAGFIALIVIAALFLVVYAIGMMRKWKVQSAVLTMQRDVHELKELLARDQQPKN